MVQAITQQQRPHNAPLDFVTRYLNEQPNRGLTADGKQDPAVVNRGITEYFQSIERPRPQSTQRPFDVTKFTNWTTQVATSRGAENRELITL